LTQPNHLLMHVDWFYIGFLEIRILDLLDVGIVGYLIYRIQKLLRGSVAFNIFIGVVILYLTYWLVDLMQMQLLSLLLGQVVSVGVIVLIIIFQPEVRKFLLFVGNTTLRGRSNFFRKLFERSGGSTIDQRIIRDLRKAILQLSQEKLGALVVLSDNVHLEEYIESGVVINADITEPLVRSIFSKDSPLHDGGAVIYRDRLYAASCVLPVSSNTNLPQKIGLRHRAGVGVTENSYSTAIIVSEETGHISVAKSGELDMHVDETKLNEYLQKYFSLN
jgi:diadenylate cyclase